MPEGGCPFESTIRAAHANLELLREVFTQLVKHMEDMSNTLDELVPGYREQMSTKIRRQLNAFLNDCKRPERN